MPELPPGADTFREDACTLICRVIQLAQCSKNHFCNADGTANSKGRSSHKKSAKLCKQAHVLLKMCLKEKPTVPACTLQPCGFSGAPG